MVQYAYENIDKDKIPSVGYQEYLGAGKKSIEAFRVILVELGIFNSRILTLSEFGRYVARYDLFFENISTLWICHYNISSKPENYVWYRFNNTILPRLDNYTYEDFYKYYDDVTELIRGERAVKNMHKEVKSVLNAYSIQQFRHLRLIYKDHENKYQMDIPGEVDPLVFLFCLLRYKENKNINATSLTIDEIINNVDTPSRVLHLNDSKVNDLINKLHRKQLISLEKFGELNQIRFPNDLTKDMVLKEIYGVVEK